MFQKIYEVITQSSVYLIVVLAWSYSLYQVGSPMV